LSWCQRKRRQPPQSTTDLPLTRQLSIMEIRAVVVLIFLCPCFSCLTCHLSQHEPISGRLCPCICAHRWSRFSWTVLPRACAHDGLSSGGTINRRPSSPAPVLVVTTRAPAPLTATDFSWYVLNAGTRRSGSPFSVRSWQPCWRASPRGVGSTSCCVMVSLTTDWL